ncbi:hypothetical protein DIPPA_14026 [Diplonema papillatum]|nr:hypothetical protein DIPPA_14031 [Diplonema papillatum]KAJ9451524.1 hypothetical protein DIPPA_14026 [Diplonema papillatum]
MMLRFVSMSAQTSWWSGTCRKSLVSTNDAGIDISIAPPYMGFVEKLILLFAFFY